MVTVVGESTRPPRRPSTPPRSRHSHPAPISTPAKPVVLVGDSGTGKSHLPIRLGLAGCEQDGRVRYVTAAQLVNEIAEVADERRLTRIVARYARLDLLCLDELGYVKLDARGSELRFQILTEREEKASMALASNLPFSEWGQVIHDPRLVAAMVDRATLTPTSSKPAHRATASRHQEPRAAEEPLNVD